MVFDNQILKLKWEKKNQIDKDNHDISEGEQMWILAMIDIKLIINLQYEIILLAQRLTETSGTE